MSHALLVQDPELLPPSRRKQLGILSAPSRRRSGLLLKGSKGHKAPMAVSQQEPFATGKSSVVGVREPTAEPHTLSSQWKMDMDNYVRLRNSSAMNDKYVHGSLRWALARTRLG